MAVAVQCRNLRKTYEGKVEAVRGLDLTIQAGECFGLLGPNGAGKTTTIEILEGLLEPTSGEVEILGTHVEDASARAAGIAGDLAAGNSPVGKIDGARDCAAVRCVLPASCVS